MIVKMAVRNLLRNKVRTLASVLTIVGAFVTIVTVKGFFFRVLADIRTFAAENELGHIQVAQAGYWDRTSKKSINQLFLMPQTIEKSIKSLPEVNSFSARLSTFGLIGFGDTQIAAKILGVDPENEFSLKNTINISEGHLFEKSDSLEIVLGVKLRERLNAKINQPIVVISQTTDGVINALELNMAGEFRTGLAYIDEQVAFMPIKTVQNLIDTEKQEYWIARLKSFQLTDKTLPKVKEIISDGNHSLEVKGWKELAELYKQAESFFNNQEFIIQMILLVLSVLAIFNTVGMAVYERTGEIGTLRSLGQTKKEIMGHFLTEGILLGSQGAILGWALGLLVKNVINSAGLTTRLPATSLPTIIQIDFQISHYIAASIFSLVVTILGSLAPAVRASQINIVEALRKNI